MHNIELSWMLQEIADLLELQEENDYKALAFRRAARTIAKAAVSVENMSEHELLGLEGVGKSVAGVLTEVLLTGESSLHRQLRNQVPVGLLQVIAIPGIGTKTAKNFYKNLGITTIDELEAAAKARKIRTLKGLGSKTELTILKGIDMLRNGIGQVPIGVAVYLAIQLLQSLRDMTQVIRADIVGSVRRRCEMIGDIDLLVTTEDGPRVAEIFIKHPLIKEVVERSDHVIRVKTFAGVMAELFFVGPQDYPFFYFFLTGSKNHLADLQQVAQSKGLTLDAGGLRYEGTTEKINILDEVEVYKNMNLPVIPPELREGRGEVTEALKGNIPTLLERKDIKGDLHLHSNWSDGVSSIEEIVAAAQKHGYAYMAITDHSKSLGIAGGLSEERLLKQRQIIGEIAEKQDAIRVLSGIEVDILNNGLDYTDEILAQMDIVVASVHNGFRQSKEQLTDRVITAIKNPHVDILAHPTGRLLGRRDPYEIDLERVFEVAAQCDTILEINASPDRLDLNDQAVRQAKEMGIKIAINTDAHDVSKLTDMDFGVSTARRGWLTKEDVVNTWDFATLQSWLEN